MQKTLGILFFESKTTEVDFTHQIVAQIETQT